MNDPTDPGFWAAYADDDLAMARSALRRRRPLPHMAGESRLRRAAHGTDGVEAASLDLSVEPMAGYRQRFADALADDLATPTALAVAHAVGAADDLSPAQRRALLLDFDRVLGLGLDRPICRIVLEALEHARFLKRRHDGIFMLRTRDSVDS